MDKEGVRVNYIRETKTAVHRKTFMAYKNEFGVSLKTVILKYFYYIINMIKYFLN